jgi:3-methyladenine DNA glycosylase AlkC
MPTSPDGRRKGSPSRATIPSDVKEALDLGLIESASLSEWLAVDLGRLAEAVAPALGLENRTREFRAFVDETRALGIMRRLRTIAEYLHRAGADAEAMRTHVSDMVRSWGALVVVMPPGLTLDQRLDRVGWAAVDPNFGVREVAWFAFRPYLAADLGNGLRLLAKWSRSPEEGLRRFASECSRPCGVWATHLPALKADPAPGLVVLEPLRADESRYVQNSVGNWLNDAGKTRPDWVRDLCARWTHESPAEATHAIVRRGLRNLR